MSRRFWAGAPRRRGAGLLRGLLVGVFVLAASGVAWGVLVTTRRLEESAQFEVHRVSVSGLDRVRENDVLAHIGYRPGLNIRRIDLDGMREAVEEIPWVRRAMLRRIWPNEMVIAVTERTPVALARIAGEIFHVDQEGVVLPPDMLADADFPILDGLRPADAAGNERKIRIYRDALDAIGEGAISEVHVSDAGEISVVPLGDALVVDLGAVDHLERWEKYLMLRSRIRQDYPAARRVDLRFRNQVIIRTRDNEPAGNILWDDGTRRL